MSLQGKGFNIIRGGAEEGERGLRKNVIYLGRGREDSGGRERDPGTGRGGVISRGENSAVFNKCHDREKRDNHPKKGKNHYWPRGDAAQGAKFTTFSAKKI